MWERRFHKIFGANKNFIFLKGAVLKKKVTHEKF